MYPARITLPVNDNDGNPIVIAHDYIKRRLVDEFGGFTVWDAFGGWKSGPNLTDAVIEEPVKTYEVAMTNTPDNRQKLQEIATRAGVLGDQEAVYFQFPSGQVVILEIKEALSTAEV